MKKGMAYFGITEVINSQILVENTFFANRFRTKELFGNENVTIITRVTTDDIFSIPPSFGCFYSNSNIHVHHYDRSHCFITYFHRYRFPAQRSITFCSSLFSEKLYISSSSSPVSFRIFLTTILLQRQRKVESVFVALFGCAKNPRLMLRCRFYCYALAHALVCAQMLFYLHRSAFHIDVDFLG